MVEYWADRGVTSFKAFLGITRAELKARGLTRRTADIKVTGHLCSVNLQGSGRAWQSDDLEHGFFL